jgi:hypothetical protein
MCCVAKFVEKRCLDQDYRIGGFSGWASAGRLEKILGEKYTGLGFLIIQANLKRE